MRLPLMLGATLLLSCSSPSEAPEPGTPEPETPTPPPVAYEAQGLVASEEFVLPFVSGDLTGDGIANVVVLGTGDDGDVRAVLASPLTSPPTVAAQLSDASFSQLPAPIRGDLNGDGADDLFLHDIFAGTVSVWFGPVAGALGPPDWRFVGDEASFPGISGRVADIDADGDMDLLLSASGEPEEACSISHHGTLLFRGPIAAGALTPTDAAVTFIEPIGFDNCDGWFTEVVDTNADGVTDVLIGDRSGAARVYFGPIADGTLGHADADVLLRDSVSGTWFWHHGEAAGDGLVLGYGQPADPLVVGMAYLRLPLTSPTVTPADSSRIWITPTEFFYPVQVAVGDWDGDGAIDAAVTPRYGAEIAVVMGPLAEASSSVPLRMPLSGGHGVLSAGDLDGDGAEVLVSGDQDAGLRVFRVVRIDP